MLQVAQPSAPSTSGPIPAAISTNQAPAISGTTSIAATLAKTEIASPPATPGHTLLQLRGGTMFDVSAEELLQQMESFNRDGVKEMSPELRARLSAAARKLSVDVERPEDVVTRVLVTQPVEALSVRIATELHIFSRLGNKTLTTTQLSREVGADNELMGRILRSLAAFGAIHEVSADKWTAAPGYALFKDRNFEDAFAPCQHILNKCRGSLPEHLASLRYRNPSDPLDTTIQYAYGTKGKSVTQSLTSDPVSATSLRNFSTLMAVWSEGYTQLSDIYPVEQRLAGEGYDPETVMFVDVGGGVGTKSIALKKTVPQLPGRFIVQDTSTVLANVKQDDKYAGIELDVHDFFTEQPIKGARCYYLRQVLHVQPDDKVVEILRRTKDAMTPGYSRLLVHEIITPEQGASAWVVAQDYNMMTLCGTAERTEEQWRKLFAKAGLSIGEVFINDHPSREGIMEVMI